MSGPVEAFPETEMLMCGCLVFGSTLFSLGHFMWILELVLICRCNWYPARVLESLFHFSV